MSRPQFRIAEPTDAEAFATLFGDAWPDEPQLRARAHWSSTLASDPSRYLAWVLEEKHDHEVVAAAHGKIPSKGPIMRPDTQRAAFEIDHFDVHPEHRRRGFGHMLLSGVEADLAARAFATAELYVERDNGDGRQFWRRQGWIESPDPLRISEEPKSIYMTKTMPTTDQADET